MHEGATLRTFVEKTYWRPSISHFVEKAGIPHDATIDRVCGMAQSKSRLLAASLIASADFIRQRCAS